MAKTSILTMGNKVPLGQIEVGPVIGGGGFGIVHAATLAGIDFPFAIKFLDPSPFNLNLETARARFFREAEVLFKLRHPHIIAIYGVGEHEGKPYLLMERFPGMDLQKARTLVGSPSPEIVLPFIEYVAGALGYAHSIGIVHRDIKPTNLMTVKGDGRVLDFGIAALLDPDGTRLTRTGGTCVGDSFSAPELVENPRLCEPRCDVYSLGASWFWLLTGKAPKGLNWEGALRTAVKVPPDYERVLLRCLDRPEARYANMTELVADVRALRLGEKPGPGNNLPTDDDALVLGIITSKCPGDADSTTFYQVEQELNGAMTRLALVLSTRRLVRFGFVEQFTDREEWNGEPYSAMRVSQEGARWTEANHQKVETLMARLSPAPSKPLPAHSDDSDEIPF